MINVHLKYSTAFSVENECNSFFLRKKQSIIKYFSFTKEREVEKVYLLAYWLHVFGRSEEAVNVCNFLLQKEYDGDNSIWYHIEHAIGLKFVIQKQMCKYTSEHFSYINRILYAHNKNIELRAKNEIDIDAYKKMYDGLLNGQCIENELWSEKPIVTLNITDTCCAVIRELCWLIAANEAYNRKTFYIGGQKGSCKLFWDRYFMYLNEIRKCKKMDMATNKQINLP